MRRLCGCQRPSVSLPVPHLAIPIDCDSGCLRALRSSSYFRCLRLPLSNPRLSTGVPVLVRVRVRPTASGRSESRQSTSGCHCPLLLQVQVHGGRPACGHSCWNPQANMNVPQWPEPSRRAGDLVRVSRTGPCVPDFSSAREALKSTTNRRELEDQRWDTET